MRRRDDLNVRFLCERLHHVQQRRNNPSLPFRMEMRLDFIDQKEDLRGRLLVEEPAGLNVLFPTPD